MYALIVKDNGGYNPFGYNIWNGFSQTNNDELQKVEIKGILTTPNVRMNGFDNNEKTIHAIFFSTYKFAENDAKRINAILAENEQPQHNFIVINVTDLSEMLSDYV